MPRDHQKDRGASAVEFALILLPLVLIVLGIAEFGRGYHIQTTVSGAAREGVRVMALTNDQAKAKTAAKTAATSLNPALADSQIAFSSSCAPGKQITTTVSYPMTFIGLPSLVPGFPSSITLTGRGTMRCNG